MDKTDMLCEIDEEIIIMDQFDDALIGFVERNGQPPVALYDKDKVIGILMEDGLTFDDAMEGSTSM